MILSKFLVRLYFARLASKLAICGAMTYDLYHLSQIRGKDGALKKGLSKDAQRHLRQSQKGETRTAEDIFIQSLVNAGRCRQRANLNQHLPSFRPSSTARCSRAKHKAAVGLSRAFSTTPALRQTAAFALSDDITSAGFEDGDVGRLLPRGSEATTRITRDEYKQLVNTYDTPSDLWDQPEQLPSQHFPLAPRLVIPPEKEDEPPFAERHIIPTESREHALALENFRGLVRGKLGYVSLDKLWDEYENLPRPRVRHLSDRDIRRLFKHLSWVEFRDEPHAMARYFTVLEECMGEQVAILTAEWNSAISFAGRWLRHVTSQEVKRAVETWMRMENYGARADNVTFNILFDVAVRAGRFGLADTIYHELKARHMELDRRFRTSIVYYAGMRREGEAVRQAFRDLVNAGEIVDTAVMNCVILSLVRAGEPAAAENVFDRMKRLFDKKMGTGGGRRWQEQKFSAKLLQKTAKRLRAQRDLHEDTFFGSTFSTDESREEVQRASPIAPNERTYRILIQHHAFTSGDLSRIRQLLREMKEQDMRIHGSVYMHIFRGFWLHGGYAYGDWNLRALEEFWAEFSSAVRPLPDIDRVRTVDAEAQHSDEMRESEEGRPPYFTRNLAASIVKAFYKCAGRAKMFEVWCDIKLKWEDMSDDVGIDVEQIVGKFVQEDSVYMV